VSAKNSVRIEIIDVGSLPPLYWLFLAIMLLGYAILTQVVKTWFIRRFLARLDL